MSGSKLDNVREVNPVKILMTTDTVSDGEKENATKQKKSLKWTAVPAGALNFLFKRSLLRARKCYKK